MKQQTKYVYNEQNMYVDSHWTTVNDVPLYNLEIQISYYKIDNLSTTFIVHIEKDPILGIETFTFVNWFWKYWI